MTGAPGDTLRIAVVADSDTRWKWGATLARRIDESCTLHAHFLRGRATPTERQLAEIGITPDSTQVTSVADLIADPRLREADVVVLALVGGAVQAMLHGLSRAWTALPTRPLLATGYVGVVYEKLVDGLLLRAGADIVLANTAEDAERFRALLRALGADPASVVETALPFLSGGTPHQPSRERPFTVCFAAQPSSPKGSAARLHLLERAAQHARRYPARDVLIKLRSLPGEQTTHVEDHPYQLLMQRLAQPAPPNLHLVYGQMGEVLDRTDLLVTVSSTAALEALDRSIPTAVLTDFGVREALGNHWFAESGCLASWDELDEGYLPVPDPQWVRRNGVCDDRPYEAVRARIAELLDRPVLPPPQPYYTERRAGGYLPQLLARHGLDPKGDLLEATGATGADTGPLRSARRAVRRTVRGGARRFYQVGARRIAPAVRRWGQL